MTTNNNHKFPFQTCFSKQCLLTLKTLSLQNSWPSSPHLAHFVKCEKYWEQYNEKQYLVTFLIIILIYLLKLVFEQFVEFHQTLNWHLFHFFHSIKYEGGKGINVVNRAWNESDFLRCNCVFLYSNPQHTLMK